MLAWNRDPNPSGLAVVRMEAGSVEELLLQCLVLLEGRFESFDLDQAG